MQLADQSALILSGINLSKRILNKTVFRSACLVCLLNLVQSDYQEIARLIVYLDCALLVSGRLGPLEDFSSHITSVLFRVAVQKLRLLGLNLVFGGQLRDSFLI